jgi:RNA recognition motif-containing protein
MNDAQGRKLFVGNLSWGTTNEGLGEFFSQGGEVEEAVVIKDRESGRSRGFGFVTFVSADDAQAAVAASQEAGEEGLMLDGRGINANVAKPRD